MNEIKISTGVKEFNLGGKVSVFFNPTDTVFGERLYKCFTDLADKYDAYAESINLDDIDGTFERRTSLDAECRKAIDELLGTAVCEPLVGDISMIAMADGLPIWVNILTAIMDTMEVSMAEERKASEKRIAKYTAKYHR